MPASLISFSVEYKCLFFVTIGLSLIILSKSDSSNPINLKHSLGVRYLHFVFPLAQFLYCPECGSSHFEVNNEKSKKCADCGFVYYFNPSAATVALILNEKNELLVCRRAKEPAKGTLDLPGGFIDMNETGEEGVAREVLEETGLKVKKAIYQFSLPNIYVYSGFPVHTLDMFFLCTVEDMSHFSAMDDVADSFFLPLSEIHPEDFGLDSIRRGLSLFLAQCR